MSNLEWTRTPPTSEGFYAVLLDSDTNRGALLTANNPDVVYVYEAAKGLAVRGECCGCVWRDVPLVSEIKGRWAGPIILPPFPSDFVRVVF